MLNRLLNYDTVIHFADTTIDSVKPLAVTVATSSLLQVDHLLGQIALIISLAFGIYKFYVEYQVHKELINNKKLKK